MQKKGRPTARTVLLEGTFTSPVLVEAFDLTSAHDSLADQLHDLAQGLRSRLAGLQVDSVVIRRADFSPKPSGKEGPRLRLLAEGALVAAAREKISSVILGTGKDLAAITPASSKPDLDRHAKSVVSDAPTEAAAAALAGLA